MADEYGDVIPIVPDVEPVDELDPGIEIALEDDGERVEHEALEWEDDASNLAPVFAGNVTGRKELKKLSEKILAEFDKAWESTEEYRARKADDWRIFAGELEKKDYPWENCANPHVPIMLQSLSRLVSRVSMELFSDWSRTFDVSPMGPDEMEAKIARILTKHGNWQFRNQIPDFKRQMHRAILQFFVSGDVTSHSYWDPLTERNRHEILTCDEFVIPYTLTTTMPNYSDVPFKCKVLYRYRHELQRMRQEWYDVDKVLSRQAPSWEEEPEAEMAKAIAEVNGIEIPEDSSYTPYKLIWYEGWCELPKNANINATTTRNDRYIHAIIDTTTRAVMKLSIHEEPDWQDVDRFNRQVRERDQFFEAVTTYDTVIVPQAEEEGRIDADIDQGLIPPEQAQAILQSRMANPMPQQPPPPPEWMLDPEDPEEEPPPAKMRPVQMFTHGVCMENLAGNLGLGIGRIEADFNRNANTAMSQFSDAAHLANNWSLIVGDDLGFDAPFEISPGKVNKVVGVTGQELRNGIVELKPDPANAQLLQIVDKMYQYGESAIQSPAVLSGEAGKSGETYRGLASRIEQATKQLSWYGGKFAEFFEWICKANAALNFEFLPDKEILLINDHELKQPERIEISNKLYAQSYEIELRSDLRFAGQAARVSEADELVAMSMQQPALQMNFAFQHSALVKALRARGQYEMVEMLGQAPDPPQMFGPPAAPQGMGVPPGPGGAPEGIPDGGKVPPQQ